MNYKRLLSLAILIALFLACGEDPPDPILTASDFSITIDENPTVGQVLGTIETETNQENLTFSITTQSPSGALAIDASTGTLTVADASLYNFERLIQITATVFVTSGGISAEANVVITLNNVDEPFNLSDFNMSLDENPSTDQEIGTMQIKSNEEGLTYRLVTVSPAGALTIDPNNATLTVADASLFDFEFNPQITATAEMVAGPLRTTAAITITLNDLDEAFALSDFNVSVDENPTAGQVLGTVQTETTQSSLVFSLSDQSPENTLAIDASSGELRVMDHVPYDFETNPQITATVTMTAGSASTTADVTITLNDVAETLTVADFTTSINENPQADLSLGFVQVETTQSIISFSLSNQSPMGALAIDAGTGELTVADRSLFDFETDPQITATVTVEGGNLSVSANVTIDLMDRDENFTIWRGPKLTFTKANGADPSLAANQDRITDNVWITRGNSGGQIYNAVTETSATKSTSPAGTEWAVGTTDEIADLTFTTFRGAVDSPRFVAGTNLVLHLIEDDVYIDIKFLFWADRRAGGFSYERSTQ